jgi:two-component system, cell cycle response regulator DivK
MTMAKPRVLVIDDNLLNIELASCLLLADGFEVESVADPRLALLHMASFRPEVVLMDIQMPGIDGLTLTRLIKSDMTMRHIPVLAFTANAMRGDEERMRQAGCDGYLSKPIEVSRFAAQVRAHLPGGL